MIITNYEMEIKDGKRDEVTINIKSKYPQVPSTESLTAFSKLVQADLDARLNDISPTPATLSDENKNKIC